MQHTHPTTYRPPTNSNRPTMKDYNASFIYKITNGVLDYYGSSCDTYARRKSKHTTQWNTCTSKKIINGDLPWTMDIIEMFPCSCLEQLEDREAWWIMNNECVNEHVPGAVRRAGGLKAYNKKNCAQYYADNKEALIEKQKQYYEDNKEAINEQKRIKHNCDVCGGKYTTVNKATHFKSKKHQKAIADAVAVHAPPTQPQTINNTYNNTINCEVCNVTQ
jgi:hypothetical protein